jgi:hypothetical protein
MFTRRRTGLAASASAASVHGRKWQRTASRALAHALVAVCVAAVAAVLPHDAHAAGSVATLSSDLVPSRGALFGARTKPRAGRSLAEEMRFVEGELGRHLDIERIYLGWDANLPTPMVTGTLASGHIPLVSWGARKRNGTAVRWSAIANGSQDAWIASRADALRGLGRPVMLIFHHEPEDDLDEFGTPAEFAAAWRHVVSVFRARGATNVVWVWTMMSWTFGPRAPHPAASYYPGDDFVDWLAADAYNWYPCRTQRWRSLTNVVAAFRTWGRAHGKPLMLAEWGVPEDTATPDLQRKAQWFAEARAAMKKMPELKAFVYFSSDRDCDWWLDSSPASLSAFTAMAKDPYFNPLVPDPNGPTAAITTPSGGATVRGAVAVTANATDAWGVAKVELLVDGAVVGVDTAAPYAFSWNAWSHADGNATLQVRAYDGDGNVTTSQAVPVLVKNVHPSATATQTVAITSPAKGATVAGSVRVVANATAGAAVKRVEFAVNGVVTASAAVAPYTFFWATNTVANGSATIQAVGFDSAGNAGRPAMTTVKVANGPRPRQSARAIFGTEGDDVLVGTAGADVFYAGGGDDVVYGRGGNDVVYAGDGNDRVYGGPGGDRVYGGVGADEIFGGDGRDRIYGGGEDDTIYGRDGNDVVYAGDGSDRVYGGPGGDRVYGGVGADEIFGGDGRDRIYAGANADELHGGHGRDTLSGGSGRDRMRGDRGRDVVFAHDEWRDLVNGGLGHDRARADRFDRVRSAHRA